MLSPWLIISFDQLKWEWRTGASSLIQILQYLHQYCFFDIQYLIISCASRWMGWAYSVIVNNDAMYNVKLNTCGHGHVISRHESTNWHLLHSTRPLNPIHHIDKMVSTISSDQPAWQVAWSQENTYNPPSSRSEAYKGTREDRKLCRSPGRCPRQSKHPITKHILFWQE